MLPRRLKGKKTVTCASVPSPSDEELIALLAMTNACDTDEKKASLYYIAATELTQTELYELAEKAREGRGLKKNVRRSKVQQPVDPSKARD